MLCGGVSFLRGDTRSLDHSSHGCVFVLWGISGLRFRVGGEGGGCCRFLVFEHFRKSHGCEGFRV